MVNIHRFDPCAVRKSRYAVRKLRYAVRKLRNVKGSPPLPVKKNLKSIGSIFSEILIHMSGTPPATAETPEGPTCKTTTTSGNYLRRYSSYSEV